MTEAVDRLRLLQFVLIQALLLTGCSSESDRNYVECQNITGTVGKPLTLTCNITRDPSCSCTQYKWIKNGIELKSDTDCDGNPTVNYTIQNPSMKDSGTFRLWVQLTCTSIKGDLSVMLSEEVTPAPPEEVTTIPPDFFATAPEIIACFGISTSTSTSPHYRIDILFLALLSILALIGLVVIFRKYITKVFQRLFQERLNLELFKKQIISQGIV
ncbi:uncharacterized protein LOC108416060 isoform X2 [Pygocentrus nattereri]|nr:uncharacterized protein LOC108416060 isoform X2 [Pygocentrus nattereri]